MTRSKGKAIRDSRSSGGNVPVVRERKRGRSEGIWLKVSSPFVTVRSKRLGLASSSVGGLSGMGRGLEKAWGKRRRTGKRMVDRGSLDISMRSDRTRCDQTTHCLWRWTQWKSGGVELYVRSTLGCTARKSDERGSA